MPKGGFAVITIKQDVYDRAKSAFELKRRELPTRSSLSKFVSDLMLCQIEIIEKKTRDIALQRALSIDANFSIIDDRIKIDFGLSIF